MSLLVVILNLLFKMFSITIIASFYAFWFLAIYSWKFTVWVTGQVILAIEKLEAMDRGNDQARL